MRLKAVILAVMGSDALRKVVRGLPARPELDLRSKSSMRAALVASDAVSPELLLALLTEPQLGEVAAAFRIPRDVGRARLLEELLGADTAPALAAARTLPPRPTRFVAIDFETADHQRDSACAVALVRVEGERIVARECHLIRPPRRQFVFTHLHGIMWQDVAHQPTFGQLWPRLQPLLWNIDFLAAHNAPFDRSVLQACCAAAGLSPPTTPFLCTVRLARETWKLHPAKLSDVCQYLKIALQHHHAASDAEACARIVLAARERQQFQPAASP